MDLETGENREIRAGDGEYVRTLGFVGRDLVYGMARADDIWISQWTGPKIFPCIVSASSMTRCRRKPAMRKKWLLHFRGYGG